MSIRYLKAGVLPKRIYINPNDGGDEWTKYVPESLSHCCDMLYDPDGSGCMCRCLSCFAWTNEPSPNFCPGCGARVRRIFERTIPMKSEPE